MRFCLFLFFIVISAPAAPPEMATLPVNTPIYVRPELEAEVRWVTGAGEKVALHQEVGGFRRVQIRREGKWRVGFVRREDFKVRRAPDREREWWVGMGFMWSQLGYGGKTFSTEDNVTYVTDEYQSRAVSPFLVFQYGDLDFFRFVLANRKTAYQSNAQNDVQGSPVRDVKLSHDMISMSAQYAWGFDGMPAFYWGLGAELSYARAVTLTLGGRDLPVAEQDRPTYFGVQGLLGYRPRIGKGFVAGGELRPVSFVNQSPAIFGVDLSLNIMYGF